MKNLINEKTAIPISLVIVLFGGVMWLTNIANKASANSDSIDKVEKKVDTVIEMKTDIAIIKEQVSEIKKELVHRR